MGDFGGDTTKGTWLYCSAPDIARLEDYAIRTHTTHGESLVRVLYGSRGERLIFGNASLSESQAYPAGFGDAIHALWSSGCAARVEAARGIVAEAASMPPDVVLRALCEPIQDAWADASLDEVFDLL